jgi:hypothetical protein
MTEIEHLADMIYIEADIITNEILFKCIEKGRENALIIINNSCMVDFSKQMWNGLIASGIIKEVIIKGAECSSHSIGRIINKFI